jgi:hypothetical protein
MAKNPPENRDSDDLDATAFVSAQRGAPLPMGFSEDTVVHNKLRKPATLSKTEPTEHEQATQVFPVEDTTVVISESTMEVNEATIAVRAKTTEVADETEIDRVEAGELEEPTTVFSRAKASEAIPTKKRPFDLTAKASSQSLDDTDTTAFQEKIKPFDPTSGNEQFREQAIREVVTSTKPKLLSVNLNDPRLRMKTERTSEQIWKKNQQRRRQTKIVFGTLVLSMAALGATAAYLLAKLPG